MFFRKKKKTEEEDGSGLEKLIKLDEARRAEMEKNGTMFPRKEQYLWPEQRRLLRLARERHGGKPFYGHTYLTRTWWQWICGAKRPPDIMEGLLSPRECDCERVVTKSFWKKMKYRILGWLNLLPP